MPIDRRDAVFVEGLFDAYGVSCYRLAHRMVSEEQLASAIVRDVFVAVWRRESVFDPARGSVQTWLLSATHRRAVAALRSRRQLCSEGDLGAEPVRVLPRLATPERYILELTYFGGHTEPEVADLTGAAVGTIKSLTLEAMRQLAVTRAKPQAGSEVEAHSLVT